MVSNETIIDHDAVAGALGAHVSAVKPSWRHDQMQSDDGRKRAS